MKASLYTIGHSDHELDAFMRLLQQHGIKAVADVRSMPYSRRTPQFDREGLRAALALHGIDYLFMGEELGARRAEAECYVHGKAEYGRIAKTPRFAAGLEQVRATARSKPIALMCAERDPITCHRAVLVCRHLRGGELTIRHILPDGAIEEHADVEQRLLKEAGLDGGSLFADAATLIEQAYDAQGDKIAYTRPPDEAETEWCHDGAGRIIHDRVHAQER